MSEPSQDNLIIGALWCLDCYTMEGKKTFAHFMYEGMSLCESHMLAEIKQQEG